MPLLQRIAVVFLRDKGDHPQVQRRFDLTRNMVGRRTGLCMMSGAKEIPFSPGYSPSSAWGFRELLHGLPEPGGSHSGPGHRDSEKTVEHTRVNTALNKAFCGTRIGSTDLPGTDSESWRRARNQP